MNSEPLIEKNGTPASPVIVRASSVEDRRLAADRREIPTGVSFLDEGARQADDGPTCAGSDA